MPTGPQRRPQMYVRRLTTTPTPYETPASEAKPMRFTSDESWDRFALNPVINGQQMRTLLDPVEHIQKVSHSVDVSGWDFSMDRMWEDKEEEAREPASSGGHGAGVYDWMARGDRQRSPITLRLDPGQEGYGQGEGHHRSVAAAALQQERGELHPLKFDAMETGYLGATGGTKDPYGDDDDSTYQPTPTPSSQRQTERKMTPANQPKLAPRTSRRASFAWSR